MATSYPYVSAPGALVKLFEQFRKAFPAVVDAATLKKFEIAPNNESYVINTIRFLGLIDEAGKKAEGVADFFFGDDSSFQLGLGALLKEAYKPLFADHGDDAWEKGVEGLTPWFRVTDKTSDVVGGRQATTFKTLAALAGHGDLKRSSSKESSGTSSKRPAGKVPPKAAQKQQPPEKNVPKTEVILPPSGASFDKRAQSLGLTVRVEVNLPAGGTADEYDSIFASIRKHLIDRG